MQTAYKITAELERENSMRAKYYGQRRKRTFSRKLYKALCKKEYFLAAAAIGAAFAATVAMTNISARLHEKNSQGIESIVRP